MKRFYRNGHRLALTVVFAAQLLLSCNGTSPQRQFKHQSAYYMALHAADQNDEKNAIRLFNEGLKKGTDLTKRRCAEALTQFGNVRDRVESCKYLVANWKDDTALLIACAELERDNEFSLINLYTEHIDLLTAPNELVRLRLNAMLQKNDSRFEDDLRTWMLSRPLSNEHLELYEKYSNAVAETADKKTAADSAPDTIGFVAESPIKPIRLDDGEAAEPEQTIWQRLMDYRTSVYRRRYYGAYGKVGEIFAACKDAGITVPPLVVSDMGKAGLYGTTDYYAAAVMFDRAARDLDGEPGFYAHFYAGRLYDKAGRYAGQAVSHFKRAMDAAATGSQYDNALWYLLNVQLRTSAADTIASLKRYCDTWHDSAYFDDFFESLSVLLLSHQQWQDFYDIWHVIEHKASEETFGRYAYIAGRLLEDGLVNNTGGVQTREAMAAYTRVLSGGADLYYKVLALERLNVSDDEFIENTLCAPVTDTPPAVNPDAEQLLAAYAAFGFPQKIYGEWQAYRANIGMESAIQASQFLNGCGIYNKNFSVQSLRIASRTRYSAAEKIPHHLLELMFPRFYAKEITAACAENDLDEWLLYALVRSESFFDAKIASNAGAKGLTQLMDATAADIARKLNVADYDILSPATNTRFGAYYLKELIGRTDDAPLLAVFAYNAGLSNVREWVRIARRDWHTTGKSAHRSTGISMDLFLETLPYAETREYGRKVIAAAALYGWLYYKTNPADIVRALLK